MGQVERFSYTHTPRGGTRGAGGGLRDIEPTQLPDVVVFLDVVVARVKHCYM